MIIDCRTDNLVGAADFWGNALGMSIGQTPGNDPLYLKLDASSHHLDIEVQMVEHPSRVHLDIETDDIEAEVLRLEQLGARRIQQLKTWWVMEAPTGQRFCVVHAATAKFNELATTWK